MNFEKEQVPLWRQLNATATVVAAVREGVSGTAAIDSVPAELRSGVQALAFHVWRNLGRAQALRSKLVAKMPLRQRTPCCVLLWLWSGIGPMQVMTSSLW